MVAASPDRAQSSAGWMRERAGEDTYACTWRKGSSSFVAFIILTAVGFAVLSSGRSRRKRKMWSRMRVVFWSCSCDGAWGARNYGTPVSVTPAGLVTSIPRPLTQTTLIEEEHKKCLRASENIKTFG